MLSKKLQAPHCHSPPSVSNYRLQYNTIKKYSRWSFNSFEQWSCIYINKTRCERSCVHSPLADLKSFSTSSRQVDGSKNKSEPVFVWSFPENWPKNSQWRKSGSTFSCGVKRFISNLNTGDDSYVCRRWCLREDACLFRMMFVWPHTAVD